MINRLRTWARNYPEWSDAVILILGFALGANLFLLFKLSGISETYMQSLFQSYRFHWVTPTLAGIVIGTGFAFMEYNVFPKLKIRKVGWLILIRFVSFTAMILVSSILVQLFVGTIFQGYPVQSTLEIMGNFIFTELFLSLYIYLLLLGVVLNFFRAMGNRFGPGLLVNYISGKYQQPLEENRVFMFIDLNDSTSLAEEMGHEKYSRMLNRLFSTISRLAADHNGEIYQYVGDEAVITWEISPEFRFTQPINLFHAFLHTLQEEKDHYLAHFQTLPGFKASVHGGAVIVTELGHRRKELAYHGDVLNTGSRLIDRASELGKDLLVSSFIRDGLPEDKKYEVDFVEDMVLRGKQTETGIYEVRVTGSPEAV